MTTTTTTIKQNTTKNKQKLLCRVFNIFPSANQLVMYVRLDSRHRTRRHWTDKGGFQMIAIIPEITEIMTWNDLWWNDFALDGAHSGSLSPLHHWIQSVSVETDQRNMLHLGLVLVTAITDSRCIEKSWKERKTKNERKNLPVLNALVISLHLIINGADNYAK